MTYGEIEKSARQYYPALALDIAFTRAVRSRVLWGMLFVLAVCGFGMLPFVFPGLERLLYPFFPGIILLSFISHAVFFILLPFALAIVALQLYSNSFYFRGFEKILSERVSADFIPVSYEVAAFCYGTDPQDITDGLLRFSYGQLILTRAGIERAEIEQLRTGRSNRLTAQAFSVTPSGPDGKVRLFDIAMAVFKEDPEFADYLFKKGVQEKAFTDAAGWASRDVLAYKKSARWWSRDNLGRIEGIGKDWSYGAAFRLRKYAHELSAESLPPLNSKPKYIRDDVERLEAALLKAKEANALLVGEDGGSKRDVLRGFAAAVQEGSVYPALEHKKIYELDSNRLISDAREKSKFEHEFLMMLDEAAKAGNVIMVIEDLPAFMQSAAQLGSNAVSLLAPYLESPVVQFICEASPVPFHQAIEPDGTLSSKFETMILREGEAMDVLQTLQDEASVIESRQGLTIPQPTLALIIESADRYVTEGVMPDKAIDLLYELAAQAEKEKKRRLGRSDVLAFVRAKTGIPTGSVGGEEREKLVNLETILHQRVIGQDEAINAIASAMRRSRAGVASPNRPIGSFLFMGPTGVGKTETTKALAQAFFNDENRILRLDMSEYTSADSLSKLIGSFQTNAPGVLTSMLREHPYGVLLLDEFEKTTKEVMDLFLQVLDEGVFSDMHGKHVNARNTIIIATSNAGSDLIYEVVKRGEDLAAKRDEIMDAVIRQGTFRPEFLNRFDGVILFHPIDDKNLREISKLMLEKFRGRIRSRGIDLEITDDLVDYLMRFGSDPKFGARPMNRAIQDIVEQKIADKIIKGSLQPGEKVRLTAEDLV